MNKKKVLLRAPVLSVSGYGVHARQIARWLLSRKDVELIVAPVQWGQTPWLLDAQNKDGLIGELISRARDDKGPFDVSFQLQLPNEWSPALAKKNIGLTAGVEATLCNPVWVNCVNNMDHVVVPSSFVKSTFESTSESSGIKLKDNALSVIPESFVDVVEYSKVDFGLSTKFNFLTVGQLTGNSVENDRKNTFNLIKWFCETFEGNKDVGLVIKSNSGRETKIDREITKETLFRVVSSVRKSQFPRVYLLHGSMSDKEMASLYGEPSIKAFVSLTHGEGFGLPMVEAAAFGLPVIATNWSGQLEYLKFGKFVKLDFELKNVPPGRIDKNIFVENAKWADVNEHDVKRKLQKFYDKPEIPSQWALELTSKIQENFSFKAVSKQYDDLWEKING